jgi:hypothetical protein
MIEQEAGHRRIEAAVPNRQRQCVGHDRHPSTFVPADNHANGTVGDHHTSTFGGHSPRHRAGATAEVEYQLPGQGHR